GLPGASCAVFPRPPGTGPLAASGIQGGSFFPPAAFLPVFDRADPPDLPAGFLPRPLPRLLGGFDIARMLHVTRSGGCDRPAPAAGATGMSLTLPRCATKIRGLTRPGGGIGRRTSFRC